MGFLEIKFLFGLKTHVDLKANLIWKVLIHLHLAHYHVIHSQWFQV